MSNAQFLNLPRHHAPLQILQVFNNGQPSGWLGKSMDGFWFHYGNNNPYQNWVSVLMPPCINFYQQTELFQVFAQHLPSKSQQETTQQQYPEIELGALDFLYLFDESHLGSISFANPDNPVVRPLNMVAPAALANVHFNDLLKQHVQCSMPGATNNAAILISTHPRQRFADTLVYAKNAWATVQLLKNFKEELDPSNRLHALRWATNSKPMAQLTYCQRPDLDLYQQRLLGLEHVSSLLNMSSSAFQHFILGNRLIPVLQEIARTYCKNFSLETKVISALSPLLRTGKITPFLVYATNQNNLKTTLPTVFGLEYLLV
ncbi:hypothetical protein [Limnobacter parvus]|uniref:Uncharacterized protein n=1 Tax=Limnobacter parvus TaxID=2939690 RepID=A0ABT1XE62_9BURK|nr:hypothetical protein [Limnobacter parvus]MCR2745201.1 hypothetical protein [Limnobacter parvus]